MNAPLVGSGRSDVGRKRDFNEDAFAVDLNNGLFAIADGMGGAAAGEVASGLAIATLTDFIARTAGPAAAERPFGYDERLSLQANRLRSAILLANEKIYRTIEEHEEMKGMGTTLVAVLARDSGVCIGHVGDSRIYLCRDGELQQITNDHSWVNEQVALGLLSREEASRHPFRNVITRALGSREQVAPDLMELPLSPRDRLLLCSDGLTNMLDDQRILQVLRDHPEDTDAAADALIAQANEAGGEDNVTVIVAELPA
jgi:PPM family protein phosphatase